MNNPLEFLRFYRLLMRNAPKGYAPWFFPVKADSKDPDARAIAARGGSSSWKAPHVRLSPKEALDRLRLGGNVGIAARKEDPLVIIDIDDPKYAAQLPETLTIRSRKRCGFHAFTWADPSDFRLPVNIPTEHGGEVRSCDQYVVAAGSYVRTLPEDIDKQPISEEEKMRIKANPFLGMYTVEKPLPMRTITYDQLPQVFLDAHKRNSEAPKVQPRKEFKPTGKHSALFDLTIKDIFPRVREGSRVSHPAHDSVTGCNFSIRGGLATCWRHSVSLNALQLLVVLSGYMDCVDAGTGHKNSGAGASKVVGDDGAIFAAWKYAKQHGLIPFEDPIPTKAMQYVAQQHKLIENPGEMLSIDAYNKVIDIVETEY